MTAIKEILKKGIQPISYSQLTRDELMAIMKAYGKSSDGDLKMFATYGPKPSSKLWETSAHLPLWEIIFVKTGTKYESDQSCSICGAATPTSAHTHNAAPYAEGRCCGMCNEAHVVPARFNVIKNK